MRRNLLRFIVKYHFGILFVLLEIIALFILVQNNRYHRANTLNFIQKTESAIEGKSSGLKKYTNLIDENERLVNENLRLRYIVSNLRVSIPDFDDIYTDSLLTGHFEYIPARVINNSTNKQYNFVTINKGEDDSIKPGMGVISPDGVVGIVKSTSKSFARVISVLNRDVLISSRIKRTDNIGPVSWEGKNPRTGNLNDISFHVKLHEGDTIVTSGYTSAFPPDIPVGYIDNFNLKRGNYYEIEVNFAAEFESLSNVYVIKNNFKEEIITLEKRE